MHLRLMLLMLEMPKQSLEENCDVEIKKGVCGKYECPGQRVFEKYNKQRECGDTKTCYWYLTTHNLPLPKKPKYI